MAAPSRDLSDTELIQEEMAQARRALERYNQLTMAEHQAHQEHLHGLKVQVEERLDALEQRLEKLEQTTETLRHQVAAVLESKIWRTLVRGGSFIGKLSGSGRSGK